VGFCTQAQGVARQVGVQRAVDGQAARRIQAAQLLQVDIGGAAQRIALPLHRNATRHLAAQIGDQRAHFDVVHVGLDDAAFAVLLQLAGQDAAADAQVQAGDAAVAVESGKRRARGW
jgi:hypothetical protein